jgi:hypothetical protein
MIPRIVHGVGILALMLAMIALYRDISKALEDAACGAPRTPP